jgi:phosphopantothenoylcysteine decarboxylase/phosphopantothenate--cysteine ligase
MLKGKKILLGITGSIAAYKSILLLRLLVKEGAEIRLVMTPSAKDFVSPLTLSTLSNHPVLSELFDEQSWSNHVMLGRWADLFVIAPLSCNTLSKMAGGQCDNLLLAVYLSATCPVIVAPAMDEDMWKHPATKANIEKLNQFGNRIIPVESGELASGLHGEGRMAEPEQIMEYIQGFFLSGRLKGRKALVTAGPTYEPLDPVRFIGNHSTGKMGLAIADQLLHEGALVTLVCGPKVEAKAVNGLEIINVNTAEEMYVACKGIFDKTDLAIFSAAVADYKPAVVSAEKIKKKDDQLVIGLEKTKDILRTLGGEKKNGQVVIGFALETNNEKEFALDKLKNKNADMIVLNSLNDIGAGFGFDTNKITIFDKSGKNFSFETKSKKLVAKDIVDTLISLYYE